MSDLGREKRGANLRTSGIGAAILLMGAALRVAAGWNTLWLDEIWSLQIAEQVTCPLEIFTRFRVDNNHILNTLLIYAWGPEQTAIAYRLGSIVAGTLSILVVGWITARWGHVEKWTSMLVTAVSFLQIHYSSEARGYALAILLALTCYASLRRYLDQGATGWGLLFSLSGASGFFAHPTFAFCYLAAVYWSLTRWLSQPVAWRDLAGKLAVSHTLPVVSGLAFYTGFLRGIELGGGPEYQLAGVLVETASLALGGPQGGPLAILVTLAFLAGLFAGLRLLMRHQPDEWSFFLVVVLLPVVQVAITNPPFLFVRYFLISMVFGLLLCCRAVASLFVLGRRGSVAYAVIVTLFLAGNLWHTSELIRLGRGQYPEALAYMAGAARDAELRITSDHDHGNRMLVEFFAETAVPHHEVEYVDMARPWNDPPEWLVIHQARRWEMSCPKDAYNAWGTRYTLQRIFDCAKLSGWRWICYRRVR
jgi:hypothetical protein